jgi:hypothetical protein
MREFLYFVASLAGAAMLTALGILYGPQSGIWGYVLYVSAAILAVCALILLADLIRRGTARKLISQSILVSRARAATAIILVTGGALVLDYWYYANYSTNGGIWHISLGLKPPAPQAATNPALPQRPWVTQDEIDAQQKIGRTLLIYSPEEIVHMWVTQENMTAFLEKWIKIDYPTAGIPVIETKQKKDFFVVRMNVNANSLLDEGRISAYFDPKKWGEQLLRLRPGERLRAICQFEYVQSTMVMPAYHIQLDDLLAYNCDLL